VYFSLLFSLIDNCAGFGTVISFFNGTMGLSILIFLTSRNQNAGKNLAAIVLGLVGLALLVAFHVLTGWLYSKPDCWQVDGFSVS
jgi:hypothetical protein